MCRFFFKCNFFSFLSLSLTHSARVGGKYCHVSADDFFFFFILSVSLATCFTKLENLVKKCHRIDEIRIQR